MMDTILDGNTFKLEPSKIICMLRSYAAHARELDNDVPEKPQFFLKPPSSLLKNGGTIIIPEGSSEVHHEIELAVVIGKGGKDIPIDEAGSFILGYSVMLDITARDIQQEAKSSGLPWTQAKGYDTFAPFGDGIIGRGSVDWKGKRIWLKVNGETRQDSTTDLLLWPIEKIISDISHVMSLDRGDIIMTGTPAGVGPLKDGDLVTGGIDGIGAIEAWVSSK